MSGSSDLLGCPGPSSGGVAPAAFQDPTSPSPRAGKVSSPSPSARVAPAAMPGPPARPAATPHHCSLEPQAAVGAVTAQGQGTGRSDPYAPHAPTKVKQHRAAEQPSPSQPLKWTGEVKPVQGASLFPVPNRRLQNKQPQPLF